MAWFNRHKKPAPQQPTWPRTMRKLAETADWSSGIRAEAPLSVASTPLGPLLRWTGQVLDINIMVTTSSISARSGTSAGSGTASIQQFRADLGQFADTGIARTVWNYSKGDPIDSGLYCVTLQWMGVPWIISVECTHT